VGVDDRIRVGLVGCGRISSRHINAIECNPELELRALCDVDKVAMGNVCTPVSVSRFHEFEDLATYDGVDLVVLCTPSGLHAAQTCKALESGKDVVVEKPMATRWADGLKMVNAVDETGRKLFVVKQNRFNPTVEKAKKLIEDGTLGKIFLVSSHVLWSRPQAYYDSATWRGTWEFDGGALMNQASHYVDLMEWLIGPVNKVSLMASTLGRNIQVEDTACLNIEWRSGALGSLAVTMLVEEENLEGSITIIGEKGSVKIGGTALNTIEFLKSAPLKSDTDSSYQIQDVYGNGHIPFYKNVCDVLLRGQAPMSDGREGLKSLELLVAAYLSAREGREIHLPLEH
jgi:UDP-N-acetyl-2-amino-2-deoxyglucuronate dehydrogenase